MREGEIFLHVGANLFGIVVALGPGGGEARLREGAAVGLARCEFRLDAGGERGILADENGGSEPCRIEGLRRAVAVDRNAARSFGEREKRRVLALKDKA